MLHSSHISAVWSNPPHPACGRHVTFYNGAACFPHKVLAAMNRVSRLASGLLLCASLAACGHRGPPPGRALAPSKLTQIGVNAYLWRAALDTLSFMTIAQTDSNGGVLVTEWYVNPAVPNERMKVSVAILDQDLRADAVRVSTARQIQQNGQWVDAAVDASTNQKLEDIILQKARDLRRNSVG